MISANVTSMRRWANVVLVLVALGLLGTAGPTVNSGQAFSKSTASVLSRPQAAPSPPEQAPTRSFRILLSNDDGIQAPGLLALYQELSQIAEVTVVAPATEQSGVGHGITYRTPILVSERSHQGKTWYAVEAQPATCVRLGLASLMRERPDLVVSGINRGANLGLVTYISGTCAAAREAAFSGIPAIAVSLDSSPASTSSGAGMDYKPAAQFTRRVVELIRLKGGLPAGAWLNINYPAGIAKGVRITRQSVRPDEQTYEERRSPRGQRYFWNIYKPVESDALDTDVAAIREGFASVTPMQLDQTAAPVKPKLEEWFREWPARGEAPHSTTSLRY